MDKHQQRPLAEEGRRRELEAHSALYQLVNSLTGAASSAVAHQGTDFTDDERLRLRRQSRILSDAVVELIKILTDHPRADVREHRLATLFEALGAATFIASHVIDNKTLNRLRAAGAAASNSARKAKIKQIIADELAKLGRDDLSDEAVARHIQKKVCARAGADLKIGTITKYMREMSR